MAQRWINLAFRYGVALLAVAVATGLRDFLDPHLGEQMPFALYYGAALLASWWGGVGPGMVAVFASSLAASYYFIEPRLQLWPLSPTHWPTAGMFLFVGLTLVLLNEARRRAREVGERYRTLLELSPDAILIHHNLRIVYVNTACLHLLGASRPEQILGKTPFDLAHPDYHRAVEQRLHQQVVLGEAVPVMEQRLVRVDGALVDVEVIAAPVPQGDGQAIQVVLRDITSRKKADRDLRERAEELSRLNDELRRRNEELDSFAYIASHDLKEPLRGLHNYASFLLEDYAERLDAEGQDKLRTLTRLARRMEDLIESLLHYSRIGRGEMLIRATDLGEVVRDVRELLEPRLRQLGVEVRVPRPLPTVACDPVRLAEVYNNLITNAMKYNDKAVRWVEVGYLDPPSGGDRVHYVRDNGIGIPERHREAVFRIFKRLHGKQKYGGGTGVGLTIVKKIVERHGGAVWLESREGEGTTFYFTLGVEETP